MNGEVRLVGITSGSCSSTAFRNRFDGRSVAVSFIIRAYRISEDGTCPTPPGSSSVSLKPTVARTVANGAASSSSGPRGGVVSRSYVTNLRKGRIENPGLDKLAALARAMGFLPGRGSRRSYPARVGE